MKKISLLVLGVVMFSSVTSCDNYVDINQNPNNVLYKDLLADDLLSAAQTNSYRPQATTMTQYGCVLTNAWSGNSNVYGAGIFSNPEYTLNLTSTFLNGIWDNTYINVNNFQLIDQNFSDEHRYDNYVAISRILKAHYLQYVLDLYGDCPYTEAFKGAANVTPKYDDDQLTYRALIGELEAAWTMLDTPDPAAKPITAGIDVMLQGDVDKWKQMAATIELRMLLRMSNNTGDVAAFRDAHLNGFLNGKTFLQASVPINPGYTKAAQAQMNPYYFNFITSTSTKLGPSGHAYKCLAADWLPTGGSTEVITGTGVNYPMVPDPRRTKLFKNGTGASYLFAVTQGSPTGIDVYNQAGANVATKVLGNLGVGLSNPYNLIPSSGDAGSANGYVVTLAESEFLQAEAHLRGYLGGTAASALTHFNAGIDASFAYLNAGSPNAYKTAINAKDYYGFKVSNSFDMNLHAIMYQKWVALIGINGMESFIELNRTGYPTTPIALISSRPRKPYRLIYPASEYSNNSANVPNIGSDDVFTINSYSPFWLQGNPALGN